MAAERFVLDPALVEEYRHKKPPFGFNGLGEVVYLRTYAREKENGQSEVWIDTVERVVNGVFEVLQHHVVNKLHCPWDAQKVKKPFVYSLFTLVSHSGERAC